jgi:hypothetical protein
MAVNASSSGESFRTGPTPVSDPADSESPVALRPRLAVGVLFRGAARGPAARELGDSTPEPGVRESGACSSIHPVPFQNMRSGSVRRPG